MSCSCSCRTPAPKTPREKPSFWVFGTIVAIALWFAVYEILEPLSVTLASLLPVAPNSKAYQAAAFFLYDTPKVFLLLILVVFVMGVVRSYFSPDRTRALLAGKKTLAGNVAAAGLGIVTPFCSCSAVPLFIGFVSSGVPLGVTFSFLIAAPMVNEIALGLLFGLVGWPVALTYLGFGVGLAIVAGWVIGKLRLEGWLEAWVRELRSAPDETTAAEPTAADRIKFGLSTVKDIVGKVWPWMLGGIAAGAFIHGYVPDELLASVMGRNVWWSVPASVLIGVPMYSNAAGIVPVVEALLQKGASLGTVLSFMMAVTALSLPEAIILRKVLSLRLIVVYFGVVACGILAVGFLFNALFA